VTEEGVLKQMILKPVEFDNQATVAMEMKFEKMSTMRGINNPYSLIEKREFFIDVEKHRRDQENKRNISNNSRNFIGRTIFEY
jgi:hypothetical protein